jgi:hypothetical protein
MEGSGRTDLAHSPSARNGTGDLGDRVMLEQLQKEFYHYFTQEFNAGLCPDSSRFETRRICEG